MSRHILFDMLVRGGGDKKKNHLYLYAGVDTSLSISFENNSLVVTQDGGTGTHGDLEWNYPDLYFGYNACRYFFGTEVPPTFENIWDFSSPLNLKELNFTPKKIAQINLISSGRGDVDCVRDRRQWTMFHHLQ